MNTLTVSIALLVVATLIAVGLHGLWQSYRQRASQPARTAAEALSDPSSAAEPGGTGLTSADGRIERGDFSETSAGQGLAVAGADTHAAGAPASSGPAALSVGADADAMIAAAQPVNPAQAAAAEPDGARVAGRLEPTLSGVYGASAPVAEPESGPAVEDLKAIAADFTIEAAVADPGRGMQPVPAEAVSSATPSVAVAAMLSPRTDCIVELALPAPMTGQKLIQTVKTIRRFGSKPALFEGLLAPEARPAPSGEPGEPVLLLADDGGVSAADPQQDHWVPLRPELFYRSLRMGVLLANRHGALNTMEFADFSETASRLAEHLGALVMIPDMTRTLEAARALDVECIKLDAQLGLNVDSMSALSAAHLARLGRDLGLTERGSNRFVRLGKNDAVLFSMAQADRPNRLTLLLDVPRAPVDQQPWPALLQCAHDAMTAIQGHLVDDSGRPLNSRNLDSLSAELAQRYAMLDQSGFKAGSPLALRVFN